MKPRWTKIHFEVIGDVVSTLPNEEDREQLAEKFIHIFKAENETFDENRFRKGCAVRTELFKEVAK